MDELGLLIQIGAKRTEVASKFNSFCRAPELIISVLIPELTGATYPNNC
jgi:hypothetical protein